MTIRDLNSLGTVGPAEAKVVSVDKISGHANYWDIAVGLDRAVVLYDASTLSTQTVMTSPNGCGFWGWEACYGTQFTNTYGLWGRIYRLDTAAYVSTTQIYGNQEYTMEGYNATWNTVHASASSDRVAITMGYIAFRMDGSTVNIPHLAVMNLTTGGLVSSLNGATMTADVYKMCATEGHGATVYRAPGSGSYTFHMTGVNLTTGVISNVNRVIDTNVLAMTVTCSGDKLLATYTKNNGVFLKIIDLNAETTAHANPIPLMPMTAGTRTPGRSQSVGNKILTTWDTLDNGKQSIRGRIVNGDTFKPIGSDEFFISTTNEGPQTAPVSNLNGGEALVTWLSQDLVQPRIRGFKLNLNNPGSLQYGLNNFFVAPLIERDYSVRARIKY